MYRLATLIALTLTFFLTAFPSLAQVARFERLGFLEGGSATLTRQISADGSTVVGNANSPENGWEAFRWQNGELEALARIPDLNGAVTGWAASADGSIVVGGAQGIAGRWENGEVRVINDPERCEAVVAYGVSSDGSIIVGQCNHPEGGPQEPIRWLDGEIEGLGWLPDASEEFGYATAISGDGSTIVGTSRNEVWPRTSAFRWTEEDGMEKLSEAEWASLATGVSSDGSVIVGHNAFVLTPNQLVSWRWEESVGAEVLTLPDGWVGAEANDVSADGSIIVGTGYKETSEGFLSRAFIWTEEAGMRDLEEVLEGDFGLDITGYDGGMWGMGISDEGDVIVGGGQQNSSGDIISEGWRAEAPFGQPIADEATPEALADVLSAPSPNPVHGTSTFTVAVEHGQHVAVEVFDALGRQVQTVYDGALAAGMSEQLTLDASTLPAGVYMIRATGEDFAKTRRVTVVR